MKNGWIICFVVKSDWITPARKKTYNTFTQAHIAKRPKRYTLFYSPYMIQVKWIFFPHSVTNSFHLTQVHFILLYINSNMLLVILGYRSRILFRMFLEINAKFWRRFLFCFVLIFFSFGWNGNFFALFSHSFRWMFIIF